MNDLIERQAAIDASKRFTKDCNPEHFVGHQKFIEFMDNAEIGSFGHWQFANGFNMGLTAAEVAIEKLTPIKSEWIVEDIHSNWADWEICTCKQCKTEYKNFYPRNFCPNCGAIMDL